MSDNTNRFVDELAKSTATLLRRLSSQAKSHFRARFYTSLIAEIRKLQNRG